MQDFTGDSLTTTLGKVELSLRGATGSNYSDAVASFRATRNTLAAAGTIKKLVGEINVVIHAVGILLCLPHIIDANERIESVSLGAGNTGKRFDLETTKRVAEFKFIRWRGGAESIRQNELFKDFYNLAEHETDKIKLLYVLGATQPLKFLNGNRALTSILGKHRLHREFQDKFGDRYTVVRDYYCPRREVVEIKDVSMFVPELSEISEVAG